MRTTIFISIILLSNVLISCSSSKSLARAEANDLKMELAIKAIENQRFIIRAEEMISRRGGNMRLREDMNFLLVDGDNARMNLPYWGRSYDSRGISAINMSGKVTERTITENKKGYTVLNMKVKQNNDEFRVSITLGKSEKCRIEVYHPRIDPSEYRGIVTAIL